MVQHFPVCREEILAAKQLVYCMTGLINPASDYGACGQVFTETGGEERDCRTRWPKEQHNEVMY